MALPAQLANALKLARFVLANLFQSLDDESDEARAVGTVHQARCRACCSNG